MLLLIQNMIMSPLSNCRVFSTRTAAFVPLSSHQQNGVVRSNPIRLVNAPLFMSPSDSISSFASISNTLPVELANGQIQPSNLQIEQLSPTTTVIVFLIGIVPFLWATCEFWRRIAVGASFGTGSDSVIIPSPFEENKDERITIGEDNNPNSSRGRRTLDKGALTVAYLLFAVAGGSVAIALASVLMSPQTPQPPL